MYYTSMWDAVNTSMHYTSMWDAVNTEMHYTSMWDAVNTEMRVSSALCALPHVYEDSQILNLYFQRTCITFHFEIVRLSNAPTPTN